MKKSYRVKSQGLNFRIGSVRCVSGETVELDDKDYMVQVHAAQGSIEEVVERHTVTNAPRKAKE